MIALLIHKHAETKLQKGEIRVDEVFVKLWVQHFVKFINYCICSFLTWYFLKSTLNGQCEHNILERYTFNCPLLLHVSAVFGHCQVYYNKSPSINTTISWDSNIIQYIWPYIYIYILNNITISRYCCVYRRTFIIIYWYNITGWIILHCQVVFTIKVI